MLKTFSTGLRGRLDDLSRKAWFPHVPISLGVALIGVLHLIPVLDQAFLLHLLLQKPGSPLPDTVALNLSAVSQGSISIFLLVNSVGLWYRSRIAFLLSVLGGTTEAAIWYTVWETPLGAVLFGFNILFLGFMVAYHRSFNRSSMRLGTLAALTAVVVLFGYAVLGIYQLGAQFSPKIDTLSDSVYLSVVTISTVGFGDFTPSTPAARLLISSIIFLSITVLSTAVGVTLIPAVIRNIEKLVSGRHSRLVRNNHYIIVGYSVLSGNTYHELVSRNMDVTLILRHEPDKSKLPTADIDIVVGDGGDLDTLREAGAEKAKAILALMDDDSENAFVILAARELKVKAKTVAAVNDAKHLNRIRHVHPDMIIAPQVLGGELLTSLLTGERIDVKGIMDKLLGHSSA